MALWSALLSQSSRTPSVVRPSLTLFFLLAGAFLLTLVPHVEQMPLWISVTVVVAMIIRSFLEFYRLPLPSTLFCSIVAICLLAGIVIQFNTMLGREAGTAFIAGLLAIKFYELRGPRDIALIIFSCFFVVMSALLYSQALELFIYCLIMMWVLTALLWRIQIGDMAEDSLLRMLYQSGILFLQALPLAVFLFFFLPRFTGKLQVNFNDSPLGLTDIIQPGSISALANDDSPAMYVKFPNSDAPEVDSMYWRAIVLWDYHHGIWTPGEMADIPERPSLPTPHASEIEQDITIYPHFRKWLFALEYPVSNAENQIDSSSSFWSVILSGDVLQLGRGGGVLDHKTRYKVRSAPLVPRLLGPEDPERKAGIQLPEDDPRDTISPEVRALADRLHQENPTSESYILAVLHYFRSEHFIYSASPGAIDKTKDWLPIFLFKTKTGFCEHFASAFAVLMRLEHIPARLVAGYHGAEFNPYDNAYIVKQSNAHAWDEVWIESKGWTRIDPVAILPPGDGASPSSADSQGNQSEEGLSIQVAHHRLTLISGAYLPGWMRRTMLDVQLRRQQVEANWDDWVFSYDPETQNRLAQALGFGRNNRFALGLACLLAVGVCIAVFRILMKRRLVLPPVENFYATFCRSMAQSGVPRAIWEGPMAYTGRVAEAFPERKEAIRDLGSIVARARYSPSPTGIPDEKELESLLESITVPQTASSSRDPHHS